MKCLQQWQKFHRDLHNIATDLEELEKKIRSMRLDGADIDFERTEELIKVKFNWLTNGKFFIFSIYRRFSFEFGLKNEIEI